MSLAIQELEQSPLVTEQAVDEFLSGRTFPLVEGPSVTFVYRGAADSVFLQHWIYGLEASQPFQSLPGTDLWYLVMEVPPESRFEYKFEVVHGPHRRLVQDPLNPDTAKDPFGANSVCHSERHEVPEWTRPDSESRPGQVEELSFRSQFLGSTRKVLVYLPARFRQEKRYPLLVVHDGEDFLRFADLQVVLDNLIHRLELPPMVVAMTQSPRRLKEYADDPDHAKFLCEELVPQLEERFPLIGRRGARGLLGSSFGAVATLSAAWRYPDMFGNLMLQSGSFAFTDIGKNRRGPHFEPVVSFVNEYRRSPNRIADKVFVSCGTYESLIYENRSFVPLIQSTGMDVRYVESRDGHNWENWRDRLRDGLTWLFPGPIWMVYE